MSIHSVCDVCGECTACTLVDGRYLCDDCLAEYEYEIEEEYEDYEVLEGME